MYPFTNLLLLALFAAAAADLLLALRTHRALMPALQSLWQQEHFFFGQWGQNRRANVGEACYCAAVAAYELQITLCNSMARENWPWLQTALYPLLEYAFCALIGVKIVLCTRYSWRSMGLAGALYFIGRWTFFNSQNIFWIYIVLAVLGAKDVLLERPLKAFLCTGGISMAAVAALHFAGIVAPGLTSERVGSFRLTFGYGHPNTFGGLFFGLLMAYFLLRMHDLRWIDLAVLFGGGLFLLFGPASRTAALCAMLLAVLLAAIRLLPACRRWGIVRWGTTLTLPVLTAVSWYLPMLLIKIGPHNSNFGPAWLKKLDDILTCRLSMIWFEHHLYDVKIAGQQLLPWPAVDNGYVFTIYQFGPVVALLIALGMMWAIWNYWKLDRAPEAIALFVLVVYAFMEMQVYHFTTNPLVLLLAGVFFAQPPQQWPAVHKQQ